VKYEDYNMPPHSWDNYDSVKAATKANPTASFAPLEFTSSGTYRYIIKEVVPAEMILSVHKT
jgi:hypothetical protein